MPELACTPGQTVGPFFDALCFPGENALVADGHPHAIRLQGTVYDGAGQAIPDALIEIWQPDTDGNVVARSGSLRRDGTSFTGWGRSATNADGHYSFTTLTPGPVVAGGAPLFSVAVFARGLLHRLFTRAYLPDERLRADPLWSTLDIARRDTLVCVAESDGYRFDIHVQGERETVFLEYGGAP